MKLNFRLRRNPKTLTRSAFFLVVGIGVLVVTVSNVTETCRLIDTGERATGAVIALYAGATSHPEIEFRDSAGQVVRFPGNGFVSHRVGDQVEVIFKPKDPVGTAVLNEPGALWSLEIADGLLGATMVMVSLGVVFIERGESR